MHASGDNDISIVLNSKSFLGRMLIDLKWCSSGVYPLENDVSFVPASVRLFTIPSTPKFDWVDYASAVTNDGRCFRIGGYMANPFFSTTTVVRLRQFLVAFSFQEDTVTSGKRLYLPQSPSLVAVRLYNSSNPFTVDPQRFVFVSDFTAPTVVCPDNISVVAKPLETGVTVTWTEPVATDNGGPPAVRQSHFSGSFFSLKYSPHTVTYTATDAAENSASCSFNIEILYVPKIYEVKSMLPSKQEVVQNEMASFGTFVSKFYMVRFY